ncbi:glutathione S-transferase family protein [Neoehrlichia mikurensis]|uniref:Glutathione S-transferase family protein n=1 Tax=Neoehrlichia mikurensis TaxID=89586 RepID=A0A9Q9BU86_9RICK|nr:glutathione S-transferase family protein [Neoehrlichia mikurensis]QXK92108.1 glutathione S-transferase family protein [Neoehrlichia mikurensis]QXK92566.1 glutathione S-transferase family protein [Neoehrlichia mikurensis]QXK93802.1 glutathione S-transferase family protein [Neoehrlichia mikurensis]UTO55223.1 glutathione S-transferase family protein [Neoehrlichia mikurensis]UTO56143.1 glutathione S-transferase family protein [Neoehrlichia mikurensis]
MDILYHFPLCPFSRKVRILLKEKKINFNLIEENPWKKREEFIKINPVCQVPVLINNQNIIIDSQAICEYIEEVYNDFSLLGSLPYQRSEVRKLISWIDYKFYHEVTKYVISEKISKYYIKNKSPDSRFLRAAIYNLQSHIKYIEHLINTNGWLVLHELTLADIALSAHISVLDYVDIFPWNISNTVKEWYSIIKSRSSFSPILQDRILGFTPPAHYSQLDF